MEDLKTADPCRSRAYQSSEEADEPCEPRCGTCGVPLEPCLDALTVVGRGDVGTGLSDTEHSRAQWHTVGSRAAGGALLAVDGALVVQNAEHEEVPVGDSRPLEAEGACSDLELTAWQPGCGTDTGLAAHRNP